MRRILVENARRKKQPKRGGERQRVEMRDADLAVTDDAVDLLVLDEALNKLSVHDPAAAELVKLRYFAGLSVQQAGEALGMSRANAYRHWTFASAWLQCEMEMQEL